MSFFGDLLQSIDSGNVPPPPKPPKRPASTNSNRSSSDLNKSVSNLGINGSAAPKNRIKNGTKRKSEDDTQTKSEKLIRPNPIQVSQGKTRPAALPVHAPSQPLSAGNPGSNTPAASTSKGPSKGSFAQIMARAKQTQAERGQTHVGMIKHQAVSKEKFSRLAERKREEEEQAKVRLQKAILGPRRDPMRRVDKSRSASPAKRPEPSKSKLKPPLKPPRPAAPKPSYRGTMRMNRDKPEPNDPSRNRLSRNRHSLKPNRSDDYLGTDEEDEGEDIADDDDEIYGSDASSNMEAGAFDIDAEEDRALRVGRLEDAKEEELEKRLKREKDEKRKRLQALADKAKKRY